jgi:hypothetical protein
MVNGLSVVCKLNGSDADTNLIEAALAAITGACSRSRKWPYQVWFEVGCALRFELGDAGFELFDATNIIPHESYLLSIL